MARIIRTIAASVAVTVCFFYLGCGGVQIANASGGANSTPLTITTKLLPSAIDGTPYVVALDAIGGTPGYTWSITAGTLPSGIALTPASGIISGTPINSGNFSVGVTLIDAGSPNEKRTSTVTIAVAPIPLVVPALALPLATDGTAYSHTLRASGGTLSYTWSITSGALPAGITLGRSTGILSGTPSSIGLSSFGVTVRDSGSPAQIQSVTMSIAAVPAALKVVTLALPQASEGVLYSQTLRATGGTPGYTWAIASGNLPSGITLAQSTGVISGTPISDTTTIFTASVHDSSSSALTLSAPITVVVNPAPLNITIPALPSVVVGKMYSQGLQAVGGTLPYTWSIASGKLAAGLTLTSSTGTISGTPTTVGATYFTAIVTDSSIPARSASTTTKIVVKPTPLAMMHTLLPCVRVGAPYSQNLQAKGGTAPYWWSIASGNLPAGLNLVASTGTISGTPTRSGTANFTAAVRDSGTPIQSATSASAVVVTATPLIITSSSLPTAKAGVGYSQTLQALGGNGPYSWSIAKGRLPSGLTLAPSTGTISGISTGGGPSTFTTTVMDGSNPVQEASTVTSLAVLSTTLTITTSALPALTAGAGYSQTLMAAGGVAPYAWSITSGHLPAGLSISPYTGVISGTPITGGTSSFTATVSDSSSPVQMYAAGMTIAGSSSPLAIVSASLFSGTSGTPYSQVMQASGGTPAYTWSIASGSLPAGLTLGATTGAISGMPSSAGMSNFTATVTDNGSPAQKQSMATSINVIAKQASTGIGATWYVRPDGGTRYSANVTTGQCDGSADVAYAGTGTNQHCAFNDFRYLWDDNSGSVGAGAWVIAGGDTVIVRGCTALAGQVNPDGTHCRVGWDHNTGAGPDSAWCYAVGSFGCYNPPIPAGTAAAHTRILGQNYAACNAGGGTNPQLYGSNLTQIFGGFGLAYTLNMQNTSYVDVQCLEITSHNGACTHSGIPASPRGCNTSPPDDYATSGILTNNATSHIAFQDVYVHGFNSAGLFGPIGGPINMTRMFVGFNAIAGWNFDDGAGTADAPGSSITASYVTMNWNGCYEEFPIVHAIPARVCYDGQSGGFGDSWSGQQTTLDSFTCDHCVDNYNTKDAFIGPHTFVTTLSITNSEAIGNMGQSWKWGGSPTPTTVKFLNNLTIANCNRLSQPIPGTPSNYNQYLSNFCRAAGNVVASDIPTGSNWLIANSTWVTYQPTLFDIACPGYSPCTSTVNITNNLFLGYNNPSNPYGTLIPAMYYIEDPSINIVSSHNNEYGMRNGDCPTGGTGTICLDPQFIGEPSQPWISEATLDNFNFNLTSGSPAIGAGATYAALPSTDYFGTPTSNPPVIGAVAP